MSDNEAGPEVFPEDAFEDAPEAALEAEEAAEEELENEEAAEDAFEEEFEDDEAEDAVDEDFVEDEAETAAPLSFVEQLLPRLVAIGEQRPDHRLDLFIQRLATFQEDKEAAAAAQAAAEAAAAAAEHERQIREADRLAVEEAAMQLAEEMAAAETAAIIAAGGPFCYPDRTIPQAHRIGEFMETMMFLFYERMMKELYDEPTPEELANLPILDEDKDPYAVMEERFDKVYDHPYHGELRKDFDKLLEKYPPQYKNTASLRVHPQVKNVHLPEFEEEELPPYDPTKTALEKTSRRFRGFYNKYVQRRRDQNQ